MVERDSQSLAVRFTAGYGIASVNIDTCLKGLLRPHRDKGERFRLTDTTTDINTALDYLSVLSVPASRHVIFPAPMGCTALVNNHRNGSDYADYCWLALHLRNRFARIVDHDSHVWTNDAWI